jgi:MFS family permease
VFSAAYAVSGYFIGGLSDRTGQRRNFLLACVLAFSALSAFCGLAQSFIFLVGARLLLGIAEGPVLPMLQSVMIPESSEHRRGFNVGFLQNVSPFLIGQLAAPIALTQLATNYNWRVTFFLTAIPGLLIFPFLWKLIRPTPQRQAAAVREHSLQAAPHATSLFRNRNVLLCVALAACTGTWILLHMTFLPLYLVRVAGYSATEMGFMMSLLGVGGCIASLILPALSDRVGRKPVLIAGFLLGLTTPLAVLFAHGATGLLTAGILVGSCVLGCTPLTITIVPSDSVPNESLARAIGLTSASSAIVGGMVMPALAGRLADIYGLQTPLWIAFGALGVAMVVACGLTEMSGARSSLVKDASLASAAE